MYAGQLIKSIVVCLCLSVDTPAVAFSTNLHELARTFGVQKGKKLIRLESKSRSIVASTTEWMMNDPKRGRGQGHVKTLHARYFVFSLLDQPWRVLYNRRWIVNNPKVGVARITWPTFLKFWDSALHHFSTGEARHFFFICWIGYGKYYIRYDEWCQRGRDQGHVSYF